MLRYKILLSVVVFLSITCNVNAAVFHVKTTGTKTIGASIADDWTDANSYGTIGAAIAEMSGGDEVIVDDGVYSGLVNAIGRQDGLLGLLTIPDGAAGSLTAIRARNPFAVTIDSGANTDSNWDSNARFVSVTGSYIKVDGFILINRDDSDASNVVADGADHVLFKRLFLRVESSTGSASGFAAWGNSSYITFEDIAFTGGYRYAFRVGGTADQSHHIIFRRFVGRGDYTVSGDPFSLVGVYGNNNTGLEGSHHVAYQNGILIDSNSSSGASNTDKHNPWYIFKSNHNISIDGCITLANEIDWFMQINLEGSVGQNLKIRNSLFWGNKSTMTTPTESVPLKMKGSTDSGGTDIFDQNTFGDQRLAFAYDGASLTDSVTNSLFKDLTAGSYTGSFSVDSNNSFSGATARGSNQVAFASDFLYLPRVETTSNRYDGGTSSGMVGAHILKRIGVEGTWHGDTGWDSKTATDLWPWAYDNEIRDLFAASYTMPSGAYPATNDTTRGFTDTAYDHTDYPLTEYIWEYLGNEIGNTNAEIEAFDFTAGYNPPPSGGGGSRLNGNSQLNNLGTGASQIRFN